MISCNLDGSILAGMYNPASTIGESSQLANKLGTTSSNSTIFSNLPEENNQNKTVQPKSGINFVLYNNKFDVVEENTGYLPVDDKINAIQVLSTDKLVMTESGFIEIFVNNEAVTPVYYDNLMVTMSSGPVMEVNAYYPYGMMITDLSLPALPAKYNAYKFGAKELQTELELNWGDHHARMYDATVGRWWVLDPLAEWRYGLSTYSYVSNNPINRIDPDGRFDTKFGAWLYKFFNGGRDILKDKDGKYFVSQERGYNDGKVSGVEVTRVYKWSDGKSYSSGNSGMDGRGGSQPSGYTFTKEGGGASPTRQQATKVSGGQIDITNLPLGGFKPRSFRMSRPTSLTPANAANSAVKALTTDRSKKDPNDTSDMKPEDSDISGKPEEISKPDSSEFRWTYMREYKEGRNTQSVSGGGRTWIKHDDTTEFKKKNNVQTFKKIR